MVASLDAFVKSLGDPGRFQLVAFVLLWSNTFPLALNNFIMVFYGLPPQHHCKLPDNSSWALNESIPWNTKKSMLDSCSMFVDPANQSMGTKACDDGWTFNSNPERSILAEWDLLCSERWKVSLSTSIYFVGVMLGGLGGGLIADKFGRYPVILTSIYVQAVLGASVAFVPNFTAFVVIRFFQAMFLQTLQTNSFTLIMELFQPRMRTIVGTISAMAWTSAIIVLASVASVIESWHTLQLIITLPSILSFFYFWFIPESMRWLISKQKVSQAEKMATKIIKFNGIEMGSDVRSQIEKISLECASGSDSSRKSSILDLVRTHTIRKYTFVLGFLWMTASLVMYGISYALPSLGGNIYASFVISGALDFVIRFLVIPTLDRFGRKWPTFGCYLASGTCCLLVPIILRIGQDSPATETVSMIAAVIGKAFMSACFAIIPIYTTELYPTVIRSLGQGLAAFLSRIGGILAPQLNYVGEIAWKPFPFVVCGIIGIIAGLLTVFLPETHRKPMPDTIQDVEGQGSESKYIAGEEVTTAKKNKDLHMEKIETKQEKPTTPVAEATTNGLANGGFEVDQAAKKNGLTVADEIVDDNKENEEKLISKATPESDGLSDQVVSENVATTAPEQLTNDSAEAQVSRL